MNILDQVEGSLAGFRPRTQAEFVALQLARRFDDAHRVPGYLAVARDHSKAVLLQAAKTALMRHELNRAPTGQLFFEALAELDGKDTV